MEKLRKMLKKNQKGFTLIELIVVIAILAVIVAIAVPRISGSLENAKETADKATIKTIRNAWQLYEAEKNTGSVGDKEWPVDYIDGAEPSEKEFPVVIDGKQYTKAQVLGEEE